MSMTDTDSIKKAQRNHGVEGLYLSEPNFDQSIPRAPRETHKMDKGLNINHPVSNRIRDALDFGTYHLSITWSQYDDQVAQNVAN